MKDAGDMAQAGTRRLAAIMFTDIVGFSRQMGADETRMLRLLEVHNQIIQQAVAAHQGEVIKIMGDAFLVNFPSVVNAVQCARHVHAQFRTHNAEKASVEQIHVRIGVHLGDIVQRDGDVFGDGVNVASRLQALAAPDTICISHKVYEEVEKKLPLGPVVSLGRPKLKNIAQRFPVYALLAEPPQGLRQALQVHWLKLSRRVGTAHRVVAAVVLVVLVSAGTLLLRNLYFPSTPGLPLPDKPSIVVLPFVNMSKDSEQEYFSDGITEDITTDLSQISSLFVIARNSAFTYKGKAVKVQDVSREMGVRYVLEGSVRKANDQVRITAQLIDATTGGHLWSERYDRPLTDIFALQDEIVQKIVTTLKLQLTLWEKGYLVRKRTDNLEAYDAYLRGGEYYDRLTKEANAQARQMVEKAIVLDPQYAQAYVVLGATYFRDWFWQWSPDPQNLERAFELAQKALALDDSLPTAHGLLGYVYVQKKQYEQAIAEEERAIALDPNHADAYVWLAEILNGVGRPQDAIGLIEKAMRLNPHYNRFLYLTNLGVAYNSTGRFEEAIAALKQVLSYNPDSLSAHVQLALSYLQAWGGQWDQDPQTLQQAFESAQRAVALNDSLSWAHSTLGIVHLWQKQPEQAIAEGERAIALNPGDASGYLALGQILTYVERPQDAIGLIEKALRLNPRPSAIYPFTLGWAYNLAGQYEEAIATLKGALARTPIDLGAYVQLAFAYSELGREEEARAAAAEVRRINPRYSLEVARQRIPLKDPAVLERYLAALRKAGLK